MKFSWELLHFFVGLPSYVCAVSEMVQSSALPFCQKAECASPSLSRQCNEYDNSYGQWTHNYTCQIKCIIGERFFFHVLYEGREELRKDCEQIYQSYYGRPGYVNVKSAVGGQRTYITCRRWKSTDEMPMLAITDIAVIFPKKGDAVPHSFYVVSKNINKGSLTAAEVYLCYKKSVIQPPSLVYAPTVISRFPLIDARNFELSPIERDCANIAMPNGASIQYWEPFGTRNVAVPSFSTFLLTNQLGVTMYGAALTFYEEFKNVSKLTYEQLTALKDLGSPSKLDNDDQTKNSLRNRNLDDINVRMMLLQCEKCICLLSRKPFFQAIKEFLMFIYGFCSTPGDRGPVPVERLISFFMYDVPSPSLDKPLIIADFGHRKIELTWPSPCSSLPQKGCSFITLLRNIGWENAIELFTLVLLEARIVFHCLRPSILTTVMETLCAAMFPLKWTGTYIPRCAREMVMSAECPGCALIAGEDEIWNILGIDNQTYDALDQYDLLSPEGRKQICFVDLNTVQIQRSEERKNQKAEKLLPKKAFKNLKKALSDCHREIDANPDIYGNRGCEFSVQGESTAIRRKRYAMELKCQEAFLKFMTQIMKGYQNFLRPGIDDSNIGTPDASSGFHNFTDLFDMNEFLKYHKSSKPFYNDFCNTHSFAHFIHLRSHVMNYSSSMDDYTNNYIVFFDQCSEKEEDARLLEIDNTLLVEHCKFVAPPEPQDPSVSYDYDGLFPKLDPSLFTVYPDDSASGKLSQNSVATASSALATPIHSRYIAGNVAASDAGIWRTPAEKKAAQSNAKDLYDASMKVDTNLISAPHIEQTGGISTLEARKWVAYLHMNCYTMWYMLLPAFVEFRMSEMAVVIRYAENLLVDMLQKFVKVPVMDGNMGSMEDIQPVFMTVSPDEVCYRVMVHVFHKHALLSNISNLQKILKKHGVKVNAGTYSYMNSMREDKSARKAAKMVALRPMNDVATDSESVLEKASVKLRKANKVKTRWCIVYCAVKFIILQRKISLMQPQTIENKNDSVDENYEEKDNGDDAVNAEQETVNVDVQYLHDNADESKPEETISTNSSSQSRLDEHVTLNSKPSMAHHRRNNSLFSDNMEQFSSLTSNKRTMSTSSAHNVNRKLFATNSQLSLASEHEVSSNRIVAQSTLSRRPQYSSVGNALEHRASSENNSTQPVGALSHVDEDLYEGSKRKSKELRPLNSSTAGSESSMNSIAERLNGANAHNFGDNFKNSMLQLSSIASKENISECTTSDKHSEDENSLKPDTPFLLPRTSSTRSSFESEGGSRSISALHKRAVNLFAKASAPLTAPTLGETAKPSMHGSTSTISEDQTSISSSIPVLGGLGLGVGAGDKNGSRENILTSAANYTQKVLQNNSTTGKWMDRIQQMKQEVMYVVSIDSSLEPDVSNLAKRIGSAKQPQTPQQASPKNQPTQQPQRPTETSRPNISAQKYDGRFRKKPIRSLVSVEMSSVYTCVNPSCQKIMYDEDIMSQWNNDDSNFSINCPCVKGMSGYNTSNSTATKCGRSQLPKLTIMIKDHRPQYLHCRCRNCINTLSKYCPEYLQRKLKPVNKDSIIQKQSLIEARQPNVTVGEDANGAGQQSVSAVYNVESNPTGSHTSLHDVSSSNADEHSLNSTTCNNRNENGPGSPQPSPRNNSEELNSSYPTPQVSISDDTCHTTMVLPRTVGPIIVNYLSPLVVRKALERLIDNTGASSEIFRSQDMVDEKTDIYWNLVWYFSRLGFRTHLNDLLLGSRVLNGNFSQNELNKTENEKTSSIEFRSTCIRTDESQSASNGLNSEISAVHVVALWDRLVHPAQRKRLNSSEQRKSQSDYDPAFSVPWESETPLFLNWVKNEDTKLSFLDPCVGELPDRWKPELAKNIFDAIFDEKEMDLVMKDILTYVTKYSKPNVDAVANPNRRALHREMLFTAIAALNQRRINIKAFYETYAESYRRVREHSYYDSKLLSQDIPPTVLATHFAAQFGNLSI